MITAHTVTLLTGIFIAGATSGATGLAFPLIAAPVLLLSYSPANAVTLAAMCSLTGQIFSIALLRLLRPSRSALPHAYLAMLLPLLTGVGSGVACFHVDSGRDDVKAGRAYFGDSLRSRPADGISFIKKIVQGE